MLIAIHILLDELEIEKSIVIHQLIDGITSLFANVGITPDKGALLELFQCCGERTTKTAMKMVNNLLETVG